MNKLKEQILELEKRIADMATVNPSISKASVGWHIEHSLLATDGVINFLKNSNPNDYKWSFNFARSYVFILNKIPRGKGKAPERSRPKEDFTKETLVVHLAKTKEKLNELNDLSKNNYFDHPFFGKLNLKPTIKFMGIHLQHHIEIINDIIKAEKL